MPPPNNSSSLEKLKKTCASPVSSNCVEWNGMDLPIIEICKGDSISDIQFKVATVVQTILTNSDLTGIDLACLLSDCTSCPEPERTVKNIISLLVSKVCELEDIIGAFSPGNQSDLPYIPLSCLSYKTAEGDTVSFALLDNAAKLIIQKVCQIDDTVNTHGSILSNHETRITELEEAQTDFTIPAVTSDCLFEGTKEVNDAYETLDTDYCEYKSVLGSASQFQQAFTRVCTDLNSKLGEQTGWTPTPATLAQYFGNLYILGCNVLSRVELIERNCCATGCDSLTVGFIVTFNGSTCTLKFTRGAGTSIPDGFTDCGSMLNISNQDNLVTSVSLEVVQDGETDEIDLSAYTKGDFLTFEIALKMCTDDVTCEKCVSKIVKYTADCCTITNTAGEDVTIFYTTKTFEA